MIHCGGFWHLTSKVQGPLLTSSKTNEVAQIWKYFSNTKTAIRIETGAMGTVKTSVHLSRMAVCVLSVCSGSVTRCCNNSIFEILVSLSYRKWFEDALACLIACIWLKTNSNLLADPSARLNCQSVNEDISKDCLIFCRHLTDYNHDE